MAEMGTPAAMRPMTGMTAPRGMPSEAVGLGRLCPPLAALVPADAGAREANASQRDLAPVTIHADQVFDIGDPPSLRIILEVQSEWDPAKRGAWAAYIALTWRSSGIPTVLVAVTLSEEVERQAALPIVLGPGATLQPLVIGPGAIPKELEPAEIEAMPALGLLVALAHRRDAAAMQVRDQTLLTAARLPREERIPLMRLLAPTLSAATLRMEEGNMQDEEMDALMIQFMARTTDRIDEAEDRALERGIELGSASGSRAATLALARRLLPEEVASNLCEILDSGELEAAVADAIRARMH
jgi:hypothetical protein